MPPIHPAFVHFPIALLTLSVLADFAGQVTGSATLPAAGKWALLGAALGAALAAAAGVFDMRRAKIDAEVHERVHRHMKVGFTVLCAIAALALWRWLIPDDASHGAGWTYLTVALLVEGLTLFQAWLGGELVYTDGVSVAPVAQGAGRAHPKGHAAETAGHQHEGHATMKINAGAKKTTAKSNEKESAGSASAVPSYTTPQLVAVAFASVLALLAALGFSASYTNLRLGARDVGGSVMPPGMITTYDTPGPAMVNMSAVHPRDVVYTAPADARGDQTLEPRIENGVKVFDIDVSVIRWNILPDRQVMAFAFNRQVPGPRIRVTEGDRVRINVTNHLPEATSVHWHGLILPNAMDGPAEITQQPIKPGEAFTYEYTTRQSGTYFYHTHNEPDRQQALGMYGALIIDPKSPPAQKAYDIEYTIQLQEWLARQGYTYPAMLMEGALPNFFTINGKAYPETEVIRMKVGQKALLRFIGTHNNFIHPMHVHGGPFRIVSTDGNAVPQSAQLDKDTVNVGPGERYDVIWTAREPGKWLIHCHIPHHTTNNNVETRGAGGLTMVIEVSG